MGALLFFVMGMALKWLAMRLDKRDGEYVELWKQDITAKQSLALSINSQNMKLDQLIENIGGLNSSIEKLREDLA